MQCVYLLALVQSGIHCHTAVDLLKGIGKEFQQLVIRRYLEKSIQKKLFCHLQSLQIKTIFQEICEIYSVTVAVYVIYIYGGHDVIGDNCSIVSKYCLFIS